MSSTLPTEHVGGAGDPYPHAIGEGFALMLGCRVTHWAPDIVEVELALGPQHLNRAGSVHGGVLATLIDVACALSGLYSGVPGRVRKAVTLSLTTHFTGQVSGGTLLARGRARAGGRSIFFASTEVVDAEGRAIAHGEAVNRYRRGSETADGVPSDEQHS